MAFSGYAQHWGMMLAKLALFLLIFCLHFLSVSSAALPETNENIPTLKKLSENKFKTLQVDQRLSHPTVDKSKSSFHNKDLIPNEYKFIIKFDKISGSLNITNVQQIHSAVALQLQIHESNVHVSKISSEDNSIEIFVTYTTADSIQKFNSIQVLIPASQIVHELSPQELQKSTPLLIESIKTKSESQSESMGPLVADSELLNNFEKQLWESWQLPFLIASAFLLLLVVFVIFLFLCFRQQVLKKVQEEEQKHICIFPVVKPEIQNINPVQPEGTSAYLSKENLKVLKAEPIRIKAKGLLERRGSNASLTIDLNPSQESSFSYSSPSRESTIKEKQPAVSSVKSITQHLSDLPINEGNSEEFLLSAGNRMSRKQLRQCVKDIKALHCEFWDIPMNHPEKVEIAGSGTKNRYKTIIPNEHSRVKLPEVNGDPLSTYINANYIRGYDGEEKAYIACQGPMAHTVEDFWTMVWQERAPIIVMITKLKEKNKVKCEPYVPEVEFNYGSFNITTTKVTPRDGYTIRELLICKEKEYHQVQHFWFTSMPDHKTPATSKQLVAMAVEVESYRWDNNGKIKGPVIVHCSAGIGRTGCFIAISIGMRQLLEENMVDILGIVCAMRIDRGGMIQTAEQYEFLHKSLCLFERSVPEVPGE